MRRIGTMFVVSLLLLLYAPARAQVTNVTVNNQASGSVIQQGDTTTWRISLPAAGVSQNELWYDVNANGQIDPANDKLAFRFTQTDGTVGTDGPGDDDGAANGVIVSSVAVGFAPGAWVFKASQGGASLVAAFSITPFPSPANSISGVVSAAPGVEKGNLLLEATPSGDGNLGFWQGITNADGQYTINIGTSPAAGNPWMVMSSGDVQSSGVYLLSPNDTSITVSGHHTGVNFTLVKGIVITGLVTHANTGLPLENTTPHLHDAFDPFPPNGSNLPGGRTGADGKYAFVSLPGKFFMHFTGDYHTDQWWDHKTTNTDTLVLTNQDTIANINGSIIDTLTTSVPAETTVPGGFLLTQNYPNPFNPTTTIRFTVPVASHVTLRITDILGRTVRELMNQVVPSGTYENTWSPETAASGVYFCHFVAIPTIGDMSPFKITRRMIFAK